MQPQVLHFAALVRSAKAAGADVTHLDAVRQVVNWARENQDRSGLDGIRWVVEDALKFARREERRGNAYQGIILDPPAYGHGPDGERWKLDELLFGLMKNVAAILAPRDSFLVLNLYSKVIHTTDCQYAPQLFEHWRSEYNGMYDDLIAGGYRPCKICNPGSN